MAIYEVLKAKDAKDACAILSLLTITIETGDEDNDRFISKYPHLVKKITEQS